MNIIIWFIFLLLLSFAASRLILFQGHFSLGFESIFLAGTEFLFLGLLIGPHATCIVTQEALRQLLPVISLGLGWIGLLIGLQFDRRELIRVPDHIWIMGFIIAGISFLTSFFLLNTFTPHLLIRIGLPEQDDIKTIRQSITGLSFLLGWIGTVSTCSALVLLQRNTDSRGEITRLIHWLTEVRSPLAITAMGMWYGINHISLLNYTEIEKKLSQFLHPLAEDSGLREISESIPKVMSGLEWVILTLLLGILLGWILHYVTNHRLGENEMLLLLSGSVFFSGGLSSFLHLSPLFVNLIMGATLANLPNFARNRITHWMISTEKPFFVIFMILTGALWPPITPFVLAMTLLYLWGRILGLWLGSWSAGRLYLPSDSPLPQRLGFAMIPQGGVGLAIVMDYYIIHPGALAEIALGIIILAILIQQLTGPSILAAVLRSFSHLNSLRRADPEKNDPLSFRKMSP